MFLFGELSRSENGWMLAEVSRLQFEFNLGSAYYATGQRHHVDCSTRGAAPRNLPTRAVARVFSIKLRYSMCSLFGRVLTYHDSALCRPLTMRIQKLTLSIYNTRHRVHPVGYRTQPSVPYTYVLSQIPPLTSLHNRELPTCLFHHALQRSQHRLAYVRTTLQAQFLHRGPPLALSRRTLQKKMI